MRDDGRIEALEREVERLRHATWLYSSGGGGSASATLLRLESGGNDILTLASPATTFTGILSVATAITEVPVVTPVIGTTYDDGLGIGIPGGFGPAAWVVNKATDPDGVTHEDTNMTIATGNTFLSRRTVRLPLAGDPSTLVTCYLPWII